MCGIQLIIDKTSVLDSLPIRRMQQALYHRGPDATAEHIIRTPRQTAYFGFNRLRITDARAEADPLFQSPCGRYTLVYNGEIYNYHLLRNALEKKYRFRTRTDTEVLMYLLLDEGPDGLSRVNGMFAFVWYDQQEERVIAGRDRFGMKPLYYAENSRFLIIASEIRGILASRLLARELNADVIPYYLRFKFAPRPHTFYRNIFECQPGQLYQAAAGQEFSGTTPIPPYSFPVPDTITVSVLEDAVVAAVKRHTRTEVPLGLFLSGGVDSTLLLAICGELGIKNLPAFTVSHAPGDARYGTEDYVYARKAARQYGADLQEVPISGNLLDRFEEFLPTIDQPIGDWAAWLSLLLAQTARRQVKVILSGAGADELFAGYHRHWAFYQYLRYRPLLVPLLPLARISAGYLPTGSAHSLHTPFRLLHKLARQVHASPAQTFINFTAHLPLDDKMEAAGPEYGLPDSDTGDWLRTALQHDQQHYLTSDVLALTDRMTMQAGIEGRLPYLDAELAALTGQVDARFLLRNGRKWLLKEFLRRRGGAMYANRPKEGFGMPFGHWLRTRAGKPFTESLLKADSPVYRYMNYTQVRQRLDAHLTQKTDYSAELWTLSLLNAWISKEFPQETRPLNQPATRLVVPTPVPIIS
jgi:asparagine synthase (glutamine-hydrolysing)